MPNRWAKFVTSWKIAETNVWGHGMSSSAEILDALDPTAVDLAIEEFSLRVYLRDGRELVVPLAWFPRLAGATPEQLRNWRLIGNGVGIHWPDLDEDLSVAGMLLGTRCH
jgi:hypothetical protein